MDSCKDRPLSDSGRKNCIDECGGKIFNPLFKLSFIESVQIMTNAMINSIAICPKMAHSAARVTVQ